MTSQAHRIVQHRSTLAGVEALSLVTDRAYPRHSHDQFGVGVVAFGGHRSWSGVGAVEAGPGDVITVNPGEMHDGAPVNGAPRGWRILYFEPSLVAGALRDGEATLEIARPVAHVPCVAYALAGAFVEVTRERPDLLAAEQAVVQLLVTLFRHLGAAPPPRPERSPSVVRALQRLDDAPHTPVSLAELATLAGVSRFQLLRGFAREVGTTPHAYLVQRRVRLAQRLLAGGVTPAQAAAEAGFSDQSHLTRAFKRQLGVTPGRYRAAFV